jgi:glycosyltransferase involved in cell wall biosynthesis
MKILMLHNRYLIRGGEDESTDIEASLLRDHGHTVDLFEMDNRIIAERGLFGTGINTIWSRQSFRAVRERLREGRYELLHVQNPFPLFSPSVYYAASAENIPVVQALRNYRLICLNVLFYRDGRTCEDCMNKILPWPGVLHACYRDSISGSTVVAGMLFTHRLLRTWQRKVDMFYTLSEFARDKLVEGGLPADRIVVKPNLVHPDPGVGEDQRDYVLVVGRLVEEKGILTVLRAWEQYKLEIPLKIAGDGPLSSLVENMAKNLPGVDYLGKKSLSEVYTLLGRARLLIFPTHLYEVFGRVIVEAFAKGTPVLVSDIGSSGPLVTEGKTGLHFIPGDSPSLADKVQWLWEHPVESGEMGRNARREYETHYTAEKNHDILMSIFQKAIENHNRKNNGV